MGALTDDQVLNLARASISHGALRTALAIAACNDEQCVAEMNAENIAGFTGLTKAQAKTAIIELEDAKVIERLGGNVGNIEHLFVIVGAV